jgi:hypothetical protein
VSPPHVFISYDHSDVRAAEQVARVLARVGLRPWLDRWEIAPGERWETTLTRALESAAAILALVGAGPSRQVESEVHAVVAQTPGHPALVPVLLPGAHGLPDLLVDHAVLDLRDTPVDSVAGAAALLRAVLGVLPDHRTEYPGSDRTLWPNELREDLKRVRRILGDDHPDVVRIEAMLAAPAAASTSGDTADPPTTAELLRRGQVGDRDRSQPNDGSNPQDRKPSSATEGRLIQGDEHLSPGESSAGADLLARLGRGQVCQGVVSSVADFGAFVDLGGVEGVVHVSELAWKHIDHPNRNKS